MKHISAENFPQLDQLDRLIDERRAKKPAAFPRHAHDKATDRAALAPTVFHEPWWLDIASEGQWAEAKIEKGGKIVARLPYLLTRNSLGQKMLRAPAMTNVLGPALSAELAADTATRSLKQFTVIQELIAQLPNASHAWFRMHREMVNTLGFEAAGFSSTLDFTTEIAPAPSEELWKQMRDKTRNVIRRAQEKLTVSDRIDADTFLDHYESNLAEKGRDNERPRPICRALIEESVRRNTGRVLAARDEDGQIHAAIFTVWNAAQEHYLMSTRAPRGHNGAVPLLIWEALRKAAAAGRIFDTDGIKAQSNITLITGFGGAIRPRLAVSRGSVGYQAVQLARAAMGKHQAF
ncbi:GNAT family N-acetyltransferase [Sphingomonas naphthae]|uniref:GNAT family N-acetyltransferase n=1 Tax=Sphingomonas naphthae TaxID=1813468 RepID=A0ABY7TK53_9SPHN|nr:GNAT family N-acetyltransferase [Sphingomonas naphthae]WCT72775.1 GNAT family N-acetyltransferase [Sphingomonas naphthae]